MLNRPLLSIFHHVFRLQLPTGINTPVQVGNKAKREISMSLALLPLAACATTLPIAGTILCFDASLQAGSVVTTQTSSNTAKKLWMDYAKATPKPGNVLPSIAQFVTNTNWTHVRQQQWRHIEPIFALEGSAAVMAV